MNLLKLVLTVYLCAYVLRYTHVYTKWGRAITEYVCVCCTCVCQHVYLHVCVCVCMTCEYREKGMGTFYYKHKQLSQVKMQLFEKRMDWHHH